MRLTPASTTPGCRWRVRWTRAWQAAHVIPDTGMRTVRSPWTGGAGGAAGGALVSSMTESWRAIGCLLGLGDDGAAKHGHAAHEFVPTWSGRRDLYGSGLAGREELPDPECREDDLLRAPRRLLPVEYESHRRSGLHPDGGRVVAASHGDAHLGHVTIASRQRGGTDVPGSDEEVPVYPPDRREPRDDDEPSRA